MSSSLLRSTSYNAYLKKYPSLEDLKEENEDADAANINELKENSRFREQRVMVRKKEPSNQRANNHVYVKVTQQDAYVKKISYSSVFAKNCMPFKGYVCILI
jgi:hypothetical protein